MGVILIGIPVSDHHLVYTIRNKTGNENKEHVFIKYRDTKHANEFAFLSDLASTNWNWTLNFDQNQDHDPLKKYSLRLMLPEKIAKFL